MQQFWQQVVAGMANGGIYATLALALVLIHRATGVVNFAQGEMGMFSTFIAWWLIYDAKGPEITYWLGFALTLVISFAGGGAVFATIIKPLQRGGELTIVVATIALLIILNGAAGWIWTPEVKAFQSPFPSKRIHIGDVVISWQDIGTILVSFACVAVVFI